MAKKLLVFVGMMAVLIVAAVPAFAQGQYTATGVLERSARVTEDPEPTYAITDEATGRSYELFSGFVDLEPHVGERVLVYGVAGAGLSQPDGAPRGLNVTEVVPLGASGEAVTVTFDLAVDGEVPEGQTLALRLGNGPPSRFYEGPAGDAVFCATNGNPNLPVCEDGGTYSDALQVPADRPVTFEYVRLGEGSEVFYSDTRTFTRDDTVSATYTVPEDAKDSSANPDIGNGVSGGHGGSANSSGNSGSGGSGSVTGGSGSGNSSNPGSSGEANAGGGVKAKELPKTGGATLPIAGVGGALLVGGGLLIRRLSR